MHDEAGPVAIHVLATGRPHLLRMSNACHLPQLFSKLAPFMSCLCHWAVHLCFAVISLVPMLSACDQLLIAVIVGVCQVEGCLSNEMLKYVEDAGDVTGTHSLGRNVEMTPVHSDLGAASDSQS